MVNYIELQISQRFRTLCFEFNKTLQSYKKNLLKFPNSDGVEVAYELLNYIEEKLKEFHEENNETNIGIDKNSINNVIERDGSVYDQINEVVNFGKQYLKVAKELNNFILVEETIEGNDDIIQLRRIFNATNKYQYMNRYYSILQDIDKKSHVINHNHTDGYHIHYYIKDNKTNCVLLFNKDCYSDESLYWKYHGKNDVVKVDVHRIGNSKREKIYDVCFNKFYKKKSEFISLSNDPKVFYNKNLS